MRVKRITGCCLSHMLLILVIVLSLFPTILCADEDEYHQTGDPALLPSITQKVNGILTNMTRIMSNDIGTNWAFCVKDLNSDWNGAFNYQSNTRFLTSCIKKTNGDLTQRLCNAAELRLFFKSFTTRGPDLGTVYTYIKPNSNCNLTSWVSGCEPGWSCSLGENKKVDLKATNLPSRTEDCQPCCEGFFCPQGLTCMIPCPLGSYCPVAKLNKTTGICDPYSYQMPPGKPNHTCGGADLWADVGSSSEIFCSPGSYCPTTTSRVSCSSGHYCRMGSTFQQPCFKLATCNPNTANQNIHAYGIILIVALSTVLLIIYNCSDQVLTTRERRLAKRREAAARHARETAQARERWKSAKDIAKKHATGLQEQLSRTFSRKKSSKQSDQSKGLGQLPPVHPGSSGAPEQQSGSSKGKKKDNNLTKMMQSIDNNPNSHEGFNLQIGDKNIKKHAPKAKQMHTHSQIFKYAYGQLEKEKAMQQQNKNLTFSGVISMATDTEIKTRPVIEVAFKDLCLTLKGKHKYLMRCVTGKIMPGRVTAVMGPSGAGKTTFLSALAGKATGCTMTGLILINGKSESIYSYKKIIGFVPQDDIVHGNLTVEENLRFSARCRLSADMPKPDKVLVVERVIESLGLQAVRDSLVGTVEKRGISGGQRKRVNVGIEMVMEPSLLILDEPTSGLDSASSQLLLRSLRREALEGVNICMVVHQPSYSLFKMFDDLILLAKGGLTAYHGSVKKVEEYFAGIGITVPDRVNPPDHFIDILEGLEKPTGVTREQLPVRWMLHNGYPVPPDMLKLCDFDASASGSTHGGNPSDEAGDSWQDVKLNVEMQHDHLEQNFLSSKDLSNRRTPGIARQFRYFLGRVSKQRLREARLQLADYLMLLLAGACLGTLTKVNDETFGSLGYTFTVIAISLLFLQPSYARFQH
ncbi:putative white-brown complex homolog protein 30 isoform X2 [Momordica charantia]|uniref:White-brown complex homolog protein 30 isoform X2 n=1 Tax=Momordica charantia TaxID=3673 RepID=A0A6J1CRB8_MOMCH|nr:putative white-brown complex homolog protein 30 isoform X2 [Momordica charantia]